MTASLERPLYTNTWPAGRATSVLLALSLVLGCRAAPEPGPADIPPATAPGSDAPAETAAAAANSEVGVPAGTGPWTAGDTRVDRQVRGSARLTSVRTARQDGFDRVVLEFAGTEVPGYRVSYIDRPVRQCGSGDTVALAGDAWLEVVLEPADAHTEMGAPTIVERERAPGLPNLLELKMTCDFEAMVVWVGGVRSPEPYRAFVLSDPSRLVVDLRHPVR